MRAILTGCSEIYDRGSRSVQTTFRTAVRIRAVPAPRAALLALLAVLAPAAAAGGAGGEEIATGDLAWARRAEGHHGARADPAPVEEVIASYRRALELDPENLEARWKLLRALFFLGEHAVPDADRKLEIFTEGRDLAEEGIDLLASRVGGRDALDRLEPAGVAERLGGEPQAAAIYFWGGAHWGLWGRTRGKLAAARQGVAKRIRNYAETVNALDDDYELGSGHRLLGRLHAEAPWIPFITGWIDRDTAVAELERAVALGGTDALGELYLIEALLEFRPARRQEAIDRLRLLAERQPDPELLVEETQALAEARALLARVAPPR